MTEQSKLFRFLLFVRHPRSVITTWWNLQKAERDFRKIEDSIINSLSCREEFANCQRRTLKSMAALWVAAYRTRLYLAVDLSDGGAREAMQEVSPTARKLADLMLQTVARDGGNVSTLYHVPIILPTLEDLAHEPGGLS